MRKYSEPEIVVLKINVADIITESVEKEWIGFGELDEYEG